MMEKKKEESDHEFCNYDELEIQDGDKVKTVKIPISADILFCEFEERFGDKIHSLQGIPFVIIDDNVVMLNSTSALFGWLQGFGVLVKWTQATGAVSRSEFYEMVGRRLPRFSCVSKYPHYPPIKEQFYIRNVAPKKTGRLEEFLGFFSPHGELNRDLLRAAVMTVFWGGPCGRRPAFVFDGMPEDIDGNTGIGKSTVSQVIADLVGGSIEIGKSTDPDDFRRHIVNSTNMRVVRMDNIKSSKFSSDAMESVITAPQVNGWRLNCGSRSVPNIFTYFLTFNDASLSKDMAKRSVVIRLDRPVYSSTWQGRLDRFLTLHSDELVADIGYLLLSEAIQTEPKTRWTSWEVEVLHRASSNSEIADAVLAEQVVVDDDESLKEELVDLIEDKISEYWYVGAGGKKIHFDAANGCFAIPPTVLAEWVAPYLGSNLSVQRLLKKVKSLCNGKFRHLKYKSHGKRFVLWKGCAEVKMAYRLIDIRSATDVNESIEVCKFSSATRD